MDTEVVPLNRERDLPALPEKLVEFIAIDKQRRTVMIEQRRVGDTHLLTWLDRCRAIGLKFTVIPAELDDIIFARQHSHRPPTRTGADEKVEIILENREAALSLLQRGAAYRASDIHILLRGSHTEIQFRVKGELGVAGRVSQHEGEAITRAFYQGIAVAKDASYTPLEVQNAQISGPILNGTGLSSVRIVRGPSHPVEDGGGFMVLRLQYSETRASSSSIILPSLPKLQLPRSPLGELQLTSMGYSAAQAERLKFVMEGSSGLTVFTGPTGSGKTTSINELLKELARRSPGKRIVAIEDPIEYPMLFALQLVITNVGQTDPFADYLKHALRMDPDTIFLGELRSVEAFLAAFQAALTGHRVPSTVHVTDPFTVPDRIEILDPVRLARKMFWNSKIVRGVVNQRLVPHLCPNCSIPLRNSNQSLIEPRLMSALKTYGNLADVRLRGDGCPRCHESGINDRLAVAEVIATDPRLMRDGNEHGADVARRNFRKRSDSDHSILHTTMQRVLAGLVDPRDVGDNVDVVVPFEQVDE